MRVPHYTFAPNLDVSRVITGLWQLADMERGRDSLDLERTAAAMKPYVEAGLDTFDMADHYGPAETVAGLFRSTYPELDAVAFTKWVPEPGPVRREDVRRAVETALGKLRRERLDLLQFHTWSYDDPSWLEALFYLQDLKREGLIAQLGLTNVDAAHLRVALKSGLEIASNQVSFSLLDRRASGELSALCRAEGVHLLAYGTLAGGLLTERWLGHPEPEVAALATWSQMKYYRFIQAAGGWSVYQGLLGTLATLAQELGVSVANIATRYVLEQPAVRSVIIGARLGERAHLEDTLKLFSFELSAESVAMIDDALSALSPLPGDSGDEYRKPPFLTASGDLSHHLSSLPAPYEKETRADGSERVLTGTVWEGVAGYCRAVKKGTRVLISGTTATHGDIPLGGDDVAAQTHAIIDKLEGALRTLGASLDDVVRTRVYLKDLGDWEAAARAHGQRFASARPANTMVQARLIGERYLVEIEAEAELS